MNDKDEYQYNNEEEAEMAQLHSIHIHMNAVADVQRRIHEQSLKASLSHCEECGDEIPLQRREAVPGVELCVFCQERSEYGRPR